MHTLSMPKFQVGETIIALSGPFKGDEFTVHEHALEGAVYILYCETTQENSGVYTADFVDKQFERVASEDITHDLKTWPIQFQAVWDGTKTFEVRVNDRNYQVGDRLRLREWSRDVGYLGREVIAEITYMLTADDAHFGANVKEGVAILGIRNLKGKKEQ